MHIGGLPFERRNTGCNIGGTWLRKMRQEEAVKISFDWTQKNFAQTPLSGIPLVLGLLRKVFHKVEDTVQA